MDVIQLNKDIANTLVCCQETDHGNVLKLNREMQNYLQKVRAQLELALKQLERRFRINQGLMTRMLLGPRQRVGIGINGANLRGNTFYFKGSMFFKDANYRSCPNNSDYERRKKFEHEMFPMDLELCGRHVWSMQDKLGIVQGIKEQIIEFLDQQQTHRIMLTKLGKKIALHNEKLVALLPKVENTEFSIDWHEICANYVKHRHSPSSCQGMWQLYLHPKFQKGEWTEIENERLMEIAQKFEFSNWPQIALEMKDRSEYQCFVHFYTRLYVRQDICVRRWTKNDDTALLECIKNNTINGVINWNLVAGRFPQKSKKTLQGRYAYSLHPSISHEPFTDQEDVLLLAAIKEFGAIFSRIPRTLFPNRSLTQLRSRYYNVLLVRNTQHPWTLEDDEKLLKFVEEHGSANWMACANTFDGRHSRTSCRTRFLVITRYFAKNPNVSLSQLPRLKVKRSKGGLNVNSENWEEKITELQMESFINEIKATDETESVILQKEELQDDFELSETTNDVKPIINKQVKKSRKNKKQDLISMDIKQEEVDNVEEEFIDIVPKKRKRVGEGTDLKSKRIITMKRIVIDKTKLLETIEMQKKSPAKEVKKRITKTKKK